jgi:CheY-like chemotaxis protein/HPt (histidine-containing phosphotransfer) domain-containing protein
VAQRILEKQGATVAICSDGLAALEYVRAHSRLLDVVLMDVQMPNLDGNETTRRIRKDLKLTTLPIVALTAGALVAERQRALEAGMNEFISKPFDPQALIRKVRRLVEAARGAPIPMVMLDAKPARSTAGDPFMSSIDAGKVQQMFGDDLSLFKSLLARLVRDYADLAIPETISSFDELARSNLQARAHKLKGSAGMIGATRVMRLAGAVEVALKEGRSVEILEEVRGQLASALGLLSVEAELYLATAVPSSASDARTADRPAVGRADVDRLCLLLESQNIEASDRFSALLPALSEMMDAATCERLKEAIDNLDFELGAGLLRKTLLAA